MNENDQFYRSAELNRLIAEHQSQKRIEDELAEFREKIRPAPAISTDSLQSEISSADNEPRGA